VQLVSALGTDPKQQTPALVPIYNGSSLSLSFSRPKGLPDVSYIAESSTDMQTWTPLSLQLLSDGPVQTLRAVDLLSTGTQARRFIRLRFEQ
jgi:hypothetical protein